MTSAFHALLSPERDVPVLIHPLKYFIMRIETPAHTPASSPLTFASLCLPLGVVYTEVRRPCRVMILVNPHSGRGQALQLFTGHVQGMLTEASVPYTLVITGQ